MPMAAITTHIGALVIKGAHKLSERIGRPLELDTDGIWACLPAAFPETFDIHTTDPKNPTVELDYPCSMLNVRTHKEFTNTQWQVHTTHHVFPHGAAYVLQDYIPKQNRS